jgi:thioredoxin reductase
MNNMIYDAVIVGGGPAGLSAALTLGRARKRVLLCDSGPRRNAAAVHMHNFVTRDGTPPDEFRRIARQGLETYPNVEIDDARVEEIGGEAGAFNVRLSTRNVEARRVLLCTGMIDELPDIEGVRQLWGTSIFICPYCHAWEVQDKRFAYLATSVDKLGFALLLRSWTSDVVVLTSGRLSIPAETSTQFAAAGVRVEERPVARLISGADGLDRIELADGDSLPCEILFMHPPQRQVDIVESLGLRLDTMGYVEVDAMRETSRRGIYAAGDLTSPVQSAVLSAAAGMQSAANLNHGLTLELATTGALR